MKRKYIQRISIINKICMRILLAAGVLQIVYLLLAGEYLLTSIVKNPISYTIALWFALGVLQAGLDDALQEPPKKLDS